MLLAEREQELKELLEQMNNHAECGLDIIIQITNTEILINEEVELTLQ